MTTLAMSASPTSAAANSAPLAIPVFGLDFVLTATGGTLARRGPHGPHESNACFQGAGIDGRQVPAGGLFFAIKGERFDGADFAAQAVQHGAAGVVVARGREHTLPHFSATVIEVDDTVKALGDLARAHRLRLEELRVVGVAGSNGKTTTKELVAAILGAEAGDAAVHKTEGNLNNHLGVPLTLLKLADTHRFAVIEMGMSALGELSYLATIARPDVGLVVSIGPEHLEHLGTVENVAKAEGEIFAALGARGAAVWPDGDDRIAPYAEASPALTRIRFGRASGVPVRVVASKAHVDGTDVTLRLPDGQKIEARLAVAGEHNAMNAACAAAACWAFGISGDTIAKGLAAMRPAKHRSALVEIAGRYVLDDCYNASPPSVTAALEALVSLAHGRGKKAIAVLGDMLELGPEELLLHRNIGARAVELRVDHLLAVGERSRSTIEGAKATKAAGHAALADRAEHLPDVESATARAAELAAPGDVVLVKASRGARLERVLDGLRDAFAATHNSAGPEPR